MRYAFILGFGLLPSIAALIYVILNSIGGPPDYWASAPWILVLSVPFSGIAMMIALATVGVYVFASGDEVRRRNVAAGVFFTLLLATALVASSFWTRHETQTRKLGVEEEDARSFVENNELVIQAVGGSVRAVHTETLGAPNRPRAYVFAVRGAQTLYAVVQVSRISETPSFSLVCLEPRSPNDFTQGPCRVQ
jgi:hypothetical protein